MSPARTQDCGLLANTPGKELARRPSWGGSVGERERIFQKRLTFDEEQRVAG